MGASEGEERGISVRVQKVQVFEPEHLKKKKARGSKVGAGSEGADGKKWCWGGWQRWLLEILKQSEKLRFVLKSLGSNLGVLRGQLENNTSKNIVALESRCLGSFSTAYLHDFGQAT